MESVEDLYHCLKKGISFVAFKLKRVDLSSRKITDAQCELLAEVLRSNRSITSLNLSKNAIRDAGFIALCKSLQTNTALKTLIFASNLVSPGSYGCICPVLKENTTLTSLSLASYAVANSMSSDDLKVICDALESNTTLQRLWLGGNQLGNIGAQQLVRALKKNTSVTDLSLQTNSIRAPGFNDIGSLLSYQRLKALDLGYNYFDVHCKEFVQHLALSKSLTSLSLRESEIGTLALKLLCDGLKLNQSIVHLDLEGNRGFDAEAGKCLADLFKGRTFAYVSLRSTFPAGASAGNELFEALKTAQITNLNFGFNHQNSNALVQILQYNTTLQELNMDGNNIKDGMEDIFEALQCNTTLLRLSMVWVGMNEEMFENAMKYLKDNQSLTNLTLGNISVSSEVLTRAVESLSTNYAITNLTTFSGCKQLPKLLKRNRQYQKEVRLKTMLIIYNIARSADAFLIFPAEVWFLILKHVKYPGVGGFDLIAREIFANPFKIIVRAKRDDKIASEKEMQ